MAILVFIGIVPRTVEAPKCREFLERLDADPRSVTIQTGKFYTHKILDPKVAGAGYQHGPLYQRHLREHITAQWRHRCAHCGKGDWEHRTAFNLDHVKPQTAGGPDNVRNLVWSCRLCNERKSERPVDQFLRENPERLRRVPPSTLVKSDGTQLPRHIDIDDYNFRDGDDDREVFVHPEDEPHGLPAEPPAPPGPARGAADAAAGREHDGPSR